MSTSEGGIASDGAERAADSLSESDVASQHPSSPVVFLARIVAACLLVAAVLTTVIVGFVVRPYAQKHNWGTTDWANVAAIIFGIFGLLGIVAVLAGVFLTAQYILATNQILGATERTLDATVQANELSREALKTNEAMLAANREMVTEMRESRLAEARPLVLITFKVVNGRICLIIGNYGGGPAADVSFEFVPPLKNESGQVISEEPSLALGVPLLLPREPAEQVHFDQYTNYFDLDYLLGDRPQFFDVTVRYRESLEAGDIITRQIRLSLAHLAPTPVADYEIPGFEAEVSRARKWSHYTGLTAEDEELVRQAEEVVSARVLRDFDVKDGADVRRAIQENGWDVGFEVQRGGLVQLATKNQGPHRGHVVVAAGPYPRAALVRLFMV